jgi:hypothetical protein
VPRDPLWHQAASFKDTVQGNANRENRRLRVLGAAEPLIASFETQFSDRDWQASSSLLKDLTSFRKSIMDSFPHAGILGPLSWKQESCLLQSL